MILRAFNYATPSVFESGRDEARLGLTADSRRPVRFHGRVVRNVPLLRFALRAFGEVVWSRDEWQSDGEWRSAVLDPVVTVHADRLVFEAFSQDGSASAMLAIDRDLFETEGEVRAGTTNVDFTSWLWAALGEMRSSRETWLRVEAGGVEVRTAGAGGRYEAKVDLPDAWVRGFLELQAAMAFPGTRLRVRAVDLLAAIRWLEFNKARVSPRALRYEFEPGSDARLVLEPWEKGVPLVGAEHAHAERRVIRTWGRRRLRLLAPLLPFAEGVDVYLKGRAMPSFYAVRLPGMSFVLGLSGSSEQSWTGAGSLAMGQGIPVGKELVETALAQLRKVSVLGERELAAVLGCGLAEAASALMRLTRLGLAMYDLEARKYRHRELFAEPIDEVKLFPPDRREESAREWILAGRVQVELCESEENRKLRRFRTPEGPVTREVVYRDWRVKGVVANERGVELVLNEAGRLLFGTCGCAEFREHQLGRGPCAHLLALLRASEGMRVDGASSVEGRVIPDPPEDADEEGDE